MKAFINFKDITKKFGNITVIDKLNLSINKGEIFGIIGRSGCGNQGLLQAFGRGLEHSEGGPGVHLRHHVH